MAEAHPDITLNENVLANAEYKTQIATLAAADNLPDVFLLQGMNTKAWAEQGLVMDLTDTIKLLRIMINMIRITLHHLRLAISFMDIRY